MIRAYDEVYLEKAKSTLGGMLDYAVYSLHRNADSFMELFIVSGAAALFECGEVELIAGVSGVELAYRVMELSGLSHERIRPRFTNGISKEYLCGMVLAQYQWESSLSFSKITDVVSVSEIISKCDEHQQKVRKELLEAWPPDMTANTPEKQAARAGEAARVICEYINEKMSSVRNETHLKTLRLISGLSQSQLARASGVPLRTIQQYEQRRKNINKAQFEYLVMLSSVLNCDPVQLLER